MKTMPSYICKDTIVKIRNSKRTGKVINVDYDNNVVVVRSDTSVWTAQPSSLKVVSYKEVW